MKRTSLAFFFVVACNVYDTTLLVEGGAVDASGSDTGDACSMLCKNVCVDTSSDKNNCGTCGATCEVGCTGGHCDPTVLVTGLGAPHGLVLNAGKLYFANYNNINVEVMSAADGTGLKVFASAQLFPSRLATDGTTLFWTDSSNSAHPAGGQIDEEAFVPTECAPPSFDGGAPYTQCFNAQDLPAPYGIAVQGAMTFVTTTASTNMAGAGCAPDAWVSSVLSCPTSGCDVIGCSPAGGPNVLASGQTELAGIAADATNVYWADTGAHAVRFCPQPDCAGGPMPFASNVGSPFDVISDGKTVFFSDRNGIVYSCPKAGCGSAPTQLANSLDDPFLIATDGSRVYFTLYAKGVKGNGAIMSCALPSCAGGPTTHAVGLNAPYAIAVDATYIYWTEEGTAGLLSLDGRVSKLKKN